MTSMSVPTRPASNDKRVALVLQGRAALRKYQAAVYGVLCNAVCPGYVWTPLVESRVEDQAKARGISPDGVVRKVILPEQPTKRFVTVLKIGGAVAFLCSERATSITGSAPPVNGGWTAR